MCRDVTLPFFSRHGKGVYYVLEVEDMYKALYEFCFIHYISMNAAQVDNNMTDMKA